MGESWRIGIDEEHRTPLVHEGVFSRPRNPVPVELTLSSFTAVGVH
jgi:hypothetical protein